MPFDTNQQKWLPLGLNSQDTGIPFPDLGKVYAAEHRFRYSQPLLSSYDQHSCGKHLNGRSSCEAASPEGALKSSRKRFLVFDQSGNQTRLLQCGFLPSMDAEQGTILDSLNQEKGLSKDCAVSERILLHEAESEMHEDTEEINALLYSDDDCESDDDDDDDDDDEVMSSGHSPFEQACNKTTREEVLDETESSDDDDGPRRKRQKKLLDHSYKDPSPSPSLVGTITKLKGHDSNFSSSKQQETGSGLSDEQSRKDKIHTALRILESVVPGAKGKEALLLLDEAIDYLKLLKRDLNYNHW